MKRILSLLLVFLLTVPLFACSKEKKKEEIKMDFITIKDSKFMDGEKEFTFIGATNYTMNRYSYDAIDESLDYLKQSGMNVLRIVSYLDYVYGEPFESYKDETTLQILDYIIYSAKQRGIRVILDFAAIRHFLFDLGLDPYKAIDEWEKIIVNLLNRKNTFTKIAYKDEPAIFTYSIAGEPVTYGGSFDPNNNHASRDPDVVCDAILKIAKIIKEIAPKQLVSAGGLLHFNDNPTVNGKPYYEVLWESEYIDYVAVHYYPEQEKCFDGNELDYEYLKTTNWGKNDKYLEIAKRLNKPFLLEEFGYNFNLENANVEQAVNYYEYAFDLLDKADTKYIVMWNWDFCGAFGVGPQAPRLIDIIKKYSEKWNVSNKAEETYSVVRASEKIKETKVETILDFEDDETHAFIMHNNISDAGVSDAMSTKGEKSMYFNLKMEKDWHTASGPVFSFDDPVKIDDYDYLMMDIYLPETVNGVYVALSPSVNFVRTEPTEAAINGNYLLPGTWNKIIIYLNKTELNAKCVENGMAGFITDIEMKIQNKGTLITEPTTIYVDNIRLVKE